MKIFKILLSSVFFSVIILFAACDEIDEPLKEQTDSCGDEDGLVPIKKILLEDYTGHLCGNCPRAAEELKRLQSVYCDHIIPVAIHVGFFARTTSSYPADYRTEAGDTYDALFGATNMGLPQGVVNRTEYEGAYALGYQNQWQAAVEYQLDSPAEALLTINNSYNGETRSLTVDISTEFFSDISGDVYLSVMIAEDSIVSPQKDYDADPQTIDNYVHHHVFRDVLNGTWGESLAQNPLRDDFLESTFTYELDTAYHAEHCEIIAFIYRSETKEIIQAESEPLFQEPEQK